MTSITVFVVAFAVGCLTGVVVGFLSRNRHAGDSPGEPAFWALPADD